MGNVGVLLGELRSVTSYGRRKRDTTPRRKREATREDMLLVQSIHISDKFGFPQAGSRNSTESETVFIESERIGQCMNVAYIAAAGNTPNSITNQKHWFEIWKN